MEAREDTTALAPAKSRALVPNDRVAMRKTTWREEMGLLVAWPLALALWAILPLAAWGSAATAISGAVVGFAPLVLLYRGRWTLRRLRQRLDEPSAVVEEFEALASGLLVSPAVRCDAAAHAALIRLEQGDLEAALRLLASPIRDGSSSVRVRTPAVGYYGEAARSVIAWLFPESGLEALRSSVLRSAPDSSVQLHYEGVADLLAALRVVELSGGANGAAVRRAWNELDADHFGPRHPLLCTLVLGVVWRFEPSMLEALQARVASLSEHAQTIVRRRFPDLPAESAGSYRLAAAEPEQALQAIAPAELQALHSNDRVRRWLPLVLWGGPWIGFAALWIALSAIGSGSALNLLAGAVFAGLWGAEKLHRRNRVAPLAEAGVTTPARLKELSLMASRSGPRSWGVPPPQPFDRGELMLVVGLARAEAALRDGDPVQARELVGWWLSGLEQASLNAVDLHAIGSSALRVATLLGFDDAARRLKLRLTSGRGGRRRRARHRTGHGDAARAVGLAVALHSWFRGKRGAALAAVVAAARGKAIVLDAFERELYGALLGQMAEHGCVIPDGLQSLLGPRALPSWLAPLWPDVVDTGTVPPETPATPPEPEGPLALPSAEEYAQMH